MKFALLLLVLLLVLNVACKTTGGGGTGAGGGSANGNSGAEAAGEKSFTPPFQTREPERYQARMVLRSGGETESSSETFIARDGDERREDYEWMPGVRVSDLNTRAGHFLLLPDSKLYAEVTHDHGGGLAAPSGADISLPEDFSPDRLVNEARSEAVYERLGVEEWNGRAATKYRVRTLSDGGGATGTAEQLIWVDEQLGMPVRSVTVSSGAGTPQVRYSMELLDLKQEVDRGLFTVPQGYRKVLLREMLAHVEGGEKSVGRED